MQPLWESPVWLNSQSTVDYSLNRPIRPRKARFFEPHGLCDIACFDVRSFTFSFGV